MSRGPPPLLDVRGLNVSIGGAPILEEVDLAVRPGEVVGLVGESGSGKSMTALSIMRLLPGGAAMSGTVALAGEALHDLTEAQMCARRGRDIGMVFQEPMTALNPLRTIGDQVAETVRVHRRCGWAEARELARQTLDHVGLPAADFPLARYPHELSGGQRQRVVIAMAVALKPKLLIADEPTTALDVTTQARILDLLKRLVAEDGTSLIMITHDLAVVADMADRIAIMKDGAVVEEGETVALFRTMAHPYTRTLFAASGHRPHRRRPAPGETAAIDTDDRPILVARDIVRDYALPRRSLFSAPGRFRAVDAVDLTIRRGENVGLVGESGCGKSTLSRVLLALEAPERGRVELDGAELLGLTGADLMARRRHIQVVFQDPYGSFNPRHKAGRLVAEPFHLLADPLDAAERARRVGEALRNVGLSPADADKYPHEFSGGQRQRLAIARALIAEPSLIVLDEAVSALDVSIRAQVLDLLAGLSDRLGISYLFISHDLTVVRAITDRVLIMRAGKIVEEGETEAVFASPRHPYTQALIAATPNLERALERRAGRVA